jgi:eukaryotic-like serine/threonine-protein kinase
MKQCPQCKRGYDDLTAFCVFDGQRLELVADADPCVGLVLDSKYHIDRRIGKGGTGTVYQATHLQLDTTVAVKIINPQLASDSRAVERFRREALITMKVRHTNSIAVLDFGCTRIKARGQTGSLSTGSLLQAQRLGVTGGLNPSSLAGNLVESQIVYVVMELLDGVTLEQRLRECGHFSPAEACNIMKQVCAALAVAHEHHIVHRDLKPENIFFHREEDREVIKLMDYGIAKYKKLFDETEELQLTQAGFVIGTPFYMSPEQCAGSDVDARSDIYALGVLLYQLLTGVLPFTGKKANTIVMKHVTEKPRPIYEVKPDLPAVLNGVVMHALEKRPDDRPQTALVLAQELESAVRAITEQELQQVFMQATEDDLDAALLLTSEPGSGGLSIETISRRTTNTFSLDTIEVPSLSEGGMPSDEKQTFIENDKAGNDLFPELLQGIKDISVMFQIIQEYLENGVAPNPALFTELKQNMDNLRGVIFGLQSTYYRS